MIQLQVQANGSFHVPGAERLPSAEHSAGVIVTSARRIANHFKRRGLRIFRQPGISPVATDSRCTGSPGSFKNDYELAINKVRRSPVPGPISLNRQRLLFREKFAEEELHMVPGTFVCIRIITKVINAKRSSFRIGETVASPAVGN